MNHAQFKEKLLKAMGGKPPVPARETWGNFLRSEGTSFYMNYDWVKHNAFWKWVTDSEDVSAGLGGSEGSTIEIIRFGRVGHDK